MMSETGTLRFVLEAGLLIRRQVINEVTGAAWSEGLECTHERAGRTIRFTVKGDAAKLIPFSRGVDRWVAECQR